MVFTTQIIKDCTATVKINGLGTTMHEGAAGHYFGLVLLKDEREPYRYI